MAVSTSGIVVTNKPRLPLRDAISASRFTMPTDFGNFTPFPLLDGELECLGGFVAFPIAKVQPIRAA